MKLYYITIAVLFVIGGTWGYIWDSTSNPSLPTWLLLICMAVWIIVMAMILDSVYKYCKEKQWKN